MTKFILILFVLFTFYAFYTVEADQEPVIVYFNSTVQEDDLYIQPSDIGKVDLRPMPYPQN